MLLELEGMHLGLDYKELDKKLGQPDLLLLCKLGVLLWMLLDGLGLIL